MKWLAEDREQYYEAKNRDELGQKWGKDEDKFVDGEWTYRTNPDACYAAVYDSRLIKLKEETRPPYSVVLNIDNNKFQLFVYDERGYKNIIKNNLTALGKSIFEIE